MIKVKIKGPNTLPGVFNSDQKEYDLKKQRILIGRGDELIQKQNQQIGVLNLGEISKSISRVHASLIFSPAFRIRQQFIYPSYFKRFGSQWSGLPGNVLYQIWQFVKPSRKILLIDAKSKTGLYKKIQSIKIETGMQIIFGDSRPLIFHHQEIYDSIPEVQTRVNHLKEKGYFILNGDNFGSLAVSFWTLSYKGQHYILLNSPSKIFIGRSSGCQLVILEASISRKHANLTYTGQKWVLEDGDGSNVSSNGVWCRVKKMFIAYRNKVGAMIEDETTVRVGDIMLNFQIKQEYSFLNVQQLCHSMNKSTDESFNSLLRKEMEESNSPSFTKKSI